MKHITFREYIEPDRKRCEFLVNEKAWIRVVFLHEHEYYIWKYMKLLRKEEFFNHKGNIFLSTIFRILKNKLGRKLGFTIHKNVFGPGLRLWHFGNVVVNAEARVGKNCTLHGNNCIGNDGLPNSRSPRIGDNVDIGFGAIIIGDITIANNVTIAAGAVVVKSVTEEDVVVAGVPAQIVKRKRTEK